jgi:hypothetical protein
MADNPPFDLQAEIARIDRDRAETQKFVEETRKLTAEAQKLGAEQQKLFIEALKLERERWWFPSLQLLIGFATSAAIAAVVARLIH